MHPSPETVELLLCSLLLSGLVDQPMLWLQLPSIRVIAERREFYEVANHPLEID